MVPDPLRIPRRSLFVSLSGGDGANLRVIPKIGGFVRLTLHDNQIHPCPRTPIIFAIRRFSLRRRQQGPKGHGSSILAYHAPFSASIAILADGHRRFVSCAASLRSCPAIRRRFGCGAAWRVVNRSRVFSRYASSASDHSWMV